MAEINGAEKTDARYEANGIFWAMGDWQRAPALPFGLPLASYVAPFPLAVA
jgi:hypothetical protein